MLRYLLFLAVLVPVPAFAFETGQNATVVIGHGDFDSGGTIHDSPTSGTLYSPDGIAFDSGGNLWIVDTGFNRILKFSPPFSTGQNATLVLGQGDFVSTGASLSPSGLDQPYGIAFDKGGNMWVSDTNNNRIVEYAAPFRDNESASVVIGSPSFNKGIYPTSATSLAAPYGIMFDKYGNLWAVDYYDNRVLEYKPPFSSGMAASLVLGQYDFTGNSGGTTGNSLNLPSNIAFDQEGNLWVTDSLNNRVLEFRYPFSTAENASLVLGQKDFVSSLSGISNDSLNTPYGITFDHGGNLWVADGNNARVLGYVPPFTNGMPSSVVLGQQTFEGMHMGTSASLLAEPYDVRVDGKGDLWVADTENNRVLEYAAAPVPEFGPVASLVLAITVIFSLAVLKIKNFNQVLR